MGFFGFLCLAGLFAMLLNTRGKVSRLEYTIRSLETDLARLDQRAPYAQPPATSQPPITSHPAPVWTAPEPEAEILDAPEPELESQPEPEPIAWATAAEPAISEPLPEPVMTPEPEPVFTAKAQPEVEYEYEYEYEPQPQPAPIPAPARKLSINFEELFGRKLPIWAGGITLAIAGVLIVKYAIDAGFFQRVFTPGVQAICGMLFGLGLIGGAEWAHLRRAKVADPRVSQALSGAGISTLYAALLIAANIYHLISPLSAFIGVALVTAGALWLSLRHGPPSALLGLAGGLAAPALTGGFADNVPLLSVYLALTIAGMVGVSRLQRWPWLAMAAMLGGAGWSLWLVLAGHALDMLGGLSVGMFVLLLALAAPAFAFREQGRALLRNISAIVGAVQLALLVSMGGFEPLHWGLFALIAAAGQWLAWRDKAFAIVPTISAALSVLLLLLWPDPATGWLIGMGSVLGAIHAAPLIMRLWHQPPPLQRTLELCAMGFAAPLIALRHSSFALDAVNHSAAYAAALAGLVLAGSAALGWKAAGREQDSRLGWLAGCAALLLWIASWFAAPHWQAPLYAAGLTAVLLWLAKPARDSRLEAVGAVYALGAFLLLVGTMGLRAGEGETLVTGLVHTVDLASLLRWAGLTALFGLMAWRPQNVANRVTGWFLALALAYGTLAQLAPAWALPLLMAALIALALIGMKRREAPGVEGMLIGYSAASVLLLAFTGGEWFAGFKRLADIQAVPAMGLPFVRWAGLAALGGFLAWRGRLPALRHTGQIGAALLGYGALAQVLPGKALPLIAPLGIAALAGWSRKLGWPTLRTAMVSLIAVTAAWAALPLGQWAGRALASLAGQPMVIDSADLALDAVLLRLLIPALLLGASLLALRGRLPDRTARMGAAVAAIPAVVAVHTLYRLGFAALFPADFVATGLAQRLVWTALLAGGGLLLASRTKGLLASRVAPAMVAGAAMHAVWFSLLLHNPLWADQSVGTWPLINGIAPLFAALPLCLLALQRMRPDAAALLAKVQQPVLMVMIAGFGWASLRHAFHPALLTAPGLGQMEDILRSILGITLAVGFLIWGIRSHRRDWRLASLVLMLAAVAKVFLFDASALEGLLRIASFVALGFSLIGLGWLYSRQLRAEAG